MITRRNRLRFLGGAAATIYTWRCSGQVYTTCPVRGYILRLTKVIPNILSNHSPGKLSRPGWKVLEVGHEGNACEAYVIDES